MALKQITIDYWKDQGIKKLQRRIKSVQNKIKKRTERLYEMSNVRYGNRTASYWGSMNSLRVDKSVLEDLLEVEKIIIES